MSYHIYPSDYPSRSGYQGYYPWSGGYWAHQQHSYQTSRRLWRNQGMAMFHALRRKGLPYDLVRKIVESNYHSYMDYMDGDDD